jgi:hypothetical protein
MTIWILAVALLAVAVPSQAAVAVRVLLGVGDQAETDWSGGVAAQGAALAAVEPWRFDGSDAMLPGNRWKMTSRRIRLFGAAATPPARCNQPCRTRRPGRRGRTPAMAPETAHYRSGSGPAS